MAKTINVMRDVRMQLDGLVGRARARDGGEDIASEAERLREATLEIEKTLQVPDLRQGWGDSINEGARLWEKLAGLPPVVALGDYRPTDAAEAVFADLKSRIDPQIDAFDSLFENEISAFNAKLLEAGLGGILVRG
jgi:hypothetical protein